MFSSKRFMVASLFIQQSLFAYDMLKGTVIRNVHGPFPQNAHSLVEETIHTHTHTQQIHQPHLEKSYEKVALYDL